MKPVTAVCALTLAIVVGSGAWTPADTAPSGATQQLSAQRIQMAQRADRRGKIACTPAGCHRIPPGCRPEPGYDIWGNPTGFDVIVCPRRLRR